MYRIILFLFLFTLRPGFGEEQWVLHLSPEANVTEFGLRHNLTFVARHPLLDNYALFKTSRWVNRTRLGRDVAWVERQTPRKQFKRSSDPLYSQQWHLDIIGIDGVTSYGSGVHIGIVDDGLQHTHPEIKANYVADKSWNFNDDNSNPTPTYSGDGHGTSAAATAAGVQNNNKCGRGVAPAAKLVGLRTIAGPTTDYLESVALSHKKLDIYSCSWGPADNGDNMDGPGRLVQEALARMATPGPAAGRNGKGSIYVWAAGNGRDSGDSCAYDNYASNPYVNAIGAVDHTMRRAWYSEGCSSLMGVMPSSGDYKGVVTADLLGSAGYDQGDCTMSFGGTSAAAPMAAGAIALILEARPELTARDVRHILARGALPINTAAGTPEAETWPEQPNARGYSHSNSFGFGLLYVPSLLTTAATHVLVPAQVGNTTQNVYVNSVVGTPSSISIPFWGNQTFVEQVLLTVKMTHPRRGDVVIRLISPHGVVSTLSERRGDLHANMEWMFHTVHYWGEGNPTGTWKIELHDTVRGGRGRVEWVRLSVYGY